MPDPQPSGGFRWVQAPWGVVLHCEALVPHADHFFTTASLRLKDRPEEWEAIASHAGVARECLLLLRQVHGNNIVTVRSGDTGPWLPPQADAASSDDPASALVIQVADCAPILLADTRCGVVAAIHAGWRSTMQRIVIHTIEEMGTQFGTRADDLIAAIGPSLGECCAEMGEEVVEAFRAAGHDGSDIEAWFSRSLGAKPHFNLWAANRDQLIDAGMNAGAIHSAGLCTRTYKDVFHSYRAAGPGAGRMAAVIRPGKPAMPPRV
ncbi:MAG: peptidoglycan editing factor PgeF [Vicinamibacterales bacterium]